MQKSFTRPPKEIMRGEKIVTFIRRSVSRAFWYANYTARTTLFFDFLFTFLNIFRLHLPSHNSSRNIFANWHAKSWTTRDRSVNKLLNYQPATFFSLPVNFFIICTCWSVQIQSSVCQWSCSVWFMCDFSQWHNLTIMVSNYNNELSCDAEEKTRLLHWHTTNNGSVEH